MALAETRPSYHPNLVPTADLMLNLPAPWWDTEGGAALPQVNAIKDGSYVNLSTLPPISQEAKRKTGELHQTYNPNFDRREYRDLLSLKKTDPEAYTMQKTLLDSKVMYNLYTMLGERYNAGISTRVDRLLHGEIVGAHADEPLLEVFKRGRDFRFANSSAHDRKRESAEVAGFETIQNLLADEATPLGTMVISFSPPGGEESQYKHNFYDVFTLKGEQGERVIEVSRYSSSLSSGEYRALAEVFDATYFQDQAASGLPDDAYFLTRPLLLIPEEHGIAGPDALHALLHRDHEVMSLDTLNAITEGSKSLALAYITIIAENPDAIIDSNLALNAYINFSDQLHDRKDTDSGMITLFERGKDAPVSWDEIKRLGKQEVRAVTTGCGVSGGFAVDGSAGFTGLASSSDALFAPYSVVEYGYGYDKYGSRTFTCPHCNFENMRPKNTLIEFCQNTKRDESGKLKCGKSVRC